MYLQSNLWTFCCYSIGYAIYLRLACVAPTGTMMSTDGTGTYTISCGTLSGGTVPYSFQFQRVIYTAGTPSSVQSVGPNGSATVRQDTSLLLNTTAGYFVTVTDSGSPPQSVTTRPNIITYGMPAAAGETTSGTTLDEVYALLQSQSSTVQTIATNTSGRATPRF